MSLSHLHLWNHEILCPMKTGPQILRQKRWKTNGQLYDKSFRMMWERLYHINRLIDAIHKGDVTGKERVTITLNTARRKFPPWSEGISRYVFDWFKLNSMNLPMGIKRLKLLNWIQNILIDWYQYRGINRLITQFPYPNSLFLANLDPTDICGY